MYSAAKSSLTGVIESPETLRMASSLFVKILGHSVVKLCRRMVVEDEESNDVEESSDRDKTATSVDPVTTLGDYELRPSSSIEAVNLNSWPTSSTDSASPPEAGQQQKVVDKLRQLPGSAWSKRQMSEDSDEEYDRVKARHSTRYTT